MLASKSGQFVPVEVDVNRPPSIFRDPPLKQINAFIEDLKGRGVNPQAEINKLGDEVILIINNGYALAEILVNLITTPIFKPKKIDGEIVCNEDGLIEMEKDADGSMILNDSALILALQDAKTQAENI